MSLIVESSEIRGSNSNLNAGCYSRTRSTVHNLRPNAAFDDELCDRPLVISNMRFVGRAGVY